MQHMLHALAGLAAGGQIADIPFNEGEASPCLFAHDVPHHVEIFLVAGQEVVEADHGLAEGKQTFQQV